MLDFGESMRVSHLDSRDSPQGSPVDNTRELIFLRGTLIQREAEMKNSRHEYAK